MKTKDGFELDVLADFKGPDAPAVVFAHGMTVDMNGEGIFVRAYDVLSELGFSVIRFDFRAHGKSQGKTLTDFHPSGQVADLEAIVGLVKERGCSKLGLAGASFGGGTAALYAGKHPADIQALFLANPLLRYSDMLEPVAPWQKTVFTGWEAELARNGFVSLKSDWSNLVMGPQFFNELKTTNPASTLHAYQGPLMAAHGDKDDMCDLDSTRNAFNTHPNPAKRFEVIKNSGHGFHAEPYETLVTALCVGFFREHL